MRADIQFEKIDVKKQSKQKHIMLAFFGFLMLAVLSFFTVMSAVAYFTAQDSKSGEISFGTIEVKLLNGSEEFTASTFQTKYLTGILPGSTLNFNNITVRNTGDFAEYVLLNLDVSIPANAESSSNDLHYNKWYNVYGEEVISHDFSINQSEATLIGAGKNQTTNIKWKVPSEVVNNNYKTSTVKVTLQAYACQTYLPDSYAYLDKELYASYFIVSNATEIATDTGIAYLGSEAINEPLREIKGKNLFDINNYVIIHDIIAFDSSNLVIGKEYIISSNLPLTWFKISNSDNGYSSVQLYGSYTTFSFTMTRHANISDSEAQYIFLKVGDVVVNDLSLLDGYEIQIEEGSSATAYEEYAPIRDYYDITTQTLTRNVGKYVITGDEEWTNNVSEYNEYSLPKNPYVKDINSTYGLTNVYCSHFALSGLDYKTDKPKTFRVGTSYINFNLNNDSHDLAGFKQWLKAEYEAGHPVTIWYKLATSTTETVLTSKNLYAGPQKLKVDSSANVFMNMSITKDTESDYDARVPELGGQLFDYLYNKPFTISYKIKKNEGDDAEDIYIVAGLYGGNTYLKDASRSVYYSYDDSWTIVSYTVDAVSKYNFSNLNKISIWLSASSSYSYRNYEIKDIQIEIGESPTDFESYDQTVYKRVNSEVLREVNGVQDTYDISTQTITRNIEKKIFTNETRFNLVVNNNTDYVSVYASKLNIAPSLNIDNRSEILICSHLPYRYTTISYRDRVDEGIMGYGDTSAAFMLTFKAEKVGSTIESFYSWLDNQAENGNPLTIWYVRAESETVTVS